MVTFISLIWGLPWIFPIDTTPAIAIYVMSAVGSSSGIIGHYFLSQRKSYSGYFTMLDLITYSIASIYLGVYFEGVANLIIPLPVLVFTIISWKKNSTDSVTELRSLNDKQRFIYLPLAMGVVIFAFFGINILIAKGNLSSLGYLFKFLDAFGGTSTIFLFLLMWKRYKQTNTVSLINLIVAILIWSVNIAMMLNKGEAPSPHAIISIATIVGMTLNSIYTHFMWNNIKEVK